MALILIGWTEPLEKKFEALEKIESGFTKYGLSPFKTILQLNTHVDALIGLDEDDRA